MAKRIRKMARIGLNIAAKTKQKIEKELKMLINAGVMNKPEAKKLLKAFVAEIKAEKERIKSFAKKEIKREFKRARKHAKPLIKKAIKRYKR